MKLNRADRTSVGAIALGATLAVGMTVAMVSRSEGVHHHEHEVRIEHIDGVEHIEEVVIAPSVDIDEKGIRVRVSATTESGPAAAPADESGLQPLVYIDGVRVEGAGEAVMSELDPDQIERVEVVKGDAALRLFGEDATGGVIQIFLKDAGSAHPGG